jgi:polyisoprenoid-binding protein YceI
MKKIIYIPLFGIIFGCSGNSSEIDNNEQAALKECFYTLNENSFSVKWIAYKFTDKTPVEGTFNDVIINGNQTLNDLNNLVAGLSFEIPVSSINSNNPERDDKIKATFFGNLKDTDILSGKVINIDGNTLTLNLTVNGLTKEVKGTKSAENGIFKFVAKLELAKFDAGKAIDKLNQLCYDLHIGPDGISKLWDEVEISFECTYQEKC